MGGIWCENGTLEVATFSGSFCERGIDKVLAVWYTGIVGAALQVCQECL